ncbi:MAG: hypothetical protein KTM48_04170, partial [Wolbachia endosymbiont of Pissodes strobi]|nr:hypothetical protein [Wolbachia endosymbiont of Pissodes strobi]
GGISLKADGGIHLSAYRVVVVLPKRLRLKRAHIGMETWRGAFAAEGVHMVYLLTTDSITLPEAGIFLEASGTRKTSPCKKHATVFQAS